jgi:hypothetical protein
MVGKESEVNQRLPGRTRRKGHVRCESGLFATGAWPWPPRSSSSHRPPLSAALCYIPPPVSTRHARTTRHHTHATRSKQATTGVPLQLGDACQFLQSQGIEDMIALCAHKEIRTIVTSAVSARSASERATGECTLVEPERTPKGRSEMTTSTNDERIGNRRTSHCTMSTQGHRGATRSCHAWQALSVRACAQQRK